MCYCDEEKTHLWAMTFPYRSPSDVQIVSLHPELLPLITLPAQRRSCLIPLHLQPLHQLPHIKGKRDGFLLVSSFAWIYDQQAVCTIASGWYHERDRGRPCSSI